MLNNEMINISYIQRDGTHAEYVSKQLNKKKR